MLEAGGLRKGGLRGGPFNALPVPVEKGMVTLIRWVDRGCVDRGC